MEDRWRYRLRVWQQLPSILELLGSEYRYLFVAQQMLGQQRAWDWELGGWRRQKKKQTAERMEEEIFLKTECRRKGRQHGLSWCQEVRTMTNATANSLFQNSQHVKFATSTNNVNKNKPLLEINTDW